MRIYQNCKEAINEIKRNIYEMGIKVHPHSMQNKIVKDNENFSTIEIQGEVFSIENTNDKNDIVGKDLEWCQKEFGERINQTSNPGQAWKLRENVWEEFMVDDKMDYTYSERMFYQIQKIVNELKINPDTRQAIIEVHNNQLDIDSIGGKKRIPCSMFYQLMIRKNFDNIPYLNIIYVMRSSDFYTHFKNDIWLACELKDYVAKQLSITPGNLTMFIGSLHIYKKDFEQGVF